MADWTFGRIVVFKQNGEGEYDRGTDFAVANGQFGFAVTDLDFDIDGSLLISVGGRGTQGGVYRISFDGSLKGDKAIDDSKAWSETKRFISKAKAQKVSTAEIAAALKSSDARRRECAVEAMLVDSSKWTADESELVEALAIAGRKSRSGKSLFRRLLPLLTDDSQETLLATGRFSRFYAVRDKVDYEMLDEVFPLLASGLNWVRLGQLALGGCGAKGEQAIFAGYSARYQVELSNSDRQRYSKLLADALQSDLNQEAKEEVGRLAAMMGVVGSGRLQTVMSEQLKNEANVTQDIHWLICLNQIRKHREGEGASVPAPVESRIAEALVGIGEKLERDNLNIDRNFYPRLKTLASSLFKHSDPSLVDQVVKRMKGAESDVFLFESLPRSPDTIRQIALGKFAEAIKASPATATSAQLNVLANDSSGKYLPLIRSLSDRVEFYGLVIKAIMADPTPEDRKLLTTGLGLAELGTIKNAAIGLRRIFDKPRPDELAASVATARRLGWDKPSISVRDQLMMLAAKHAPEVAQKIGYQTKKQNLNQSEAMDRWEEWISTNHPDQYKAVSGNNGGVDWKTTKERMDSIAWDSGDATRGSQLYKSLQCATCHDGGARLGPKLEGPSVSRATIFSNQFFFPIRRFHSGTERLWFKPSTVICTEAVRFTIRRTELRCNRSTGQPFGSISKTSRIACVLPNR